MTRATQKYYWAKSSAIVTICLNDLGLLQPELEHITDRMRASPENPCIVFEDH